LIARAGRCQPVTFSVVPMQSASSACVFGISNLTLNLVRPPDPVLTGKPFFWTQ
jgi:hypothetical protein